MLLGVNVGSSLPWNNEGGGSEQTSPLHLLLPAQGRWTDVRLPSPVLRPTAQPAVAHGLFPGKQTSAGPLRLHCRVILLSCPLVPGPALPLGHWEPTISCCPCLRRWVSTCWLLSWWKSILRHLESHSPCLQILSCWADAKVPLFHPIWEDVLDGCITLGWLFIPLTELLRC